MAAAFTKRGSDPGRVDEAQIDKLHSVTWQVIGTMVIPHLWGCLKLELRGHFILGQFHSGCDAAYPYVEAVVVVSP